MMAGVGGHEKERHRRAGSSAGDLPAEKTLPIRQAAIGDEALLAVIHAEGTHGAATINRLQPKLPSSKTGPVIGGDPLRGDQLTKALAVYTANVRTKANEPERCAVSLRELNP